MSAKSVLVIEDDAWLGEHFASVLKDVGYKVKLEPHIFAAVGAVDEFKPDMVLADILLAGETIFPFLNELRSYEDTGELPVVVCSNLAADISFDDLKPYGVTRLLDKTTMQPDDIIAAVKDALQ
jgi:twitching motility two-component system response regulator PilH